MLPAGAASQARRAWSSSGAHERRRDAAPRDEEFRARRRPRTLWSLAERLDARLICGITEAMRTPLITLSAIVCLALGACDPSGDEAKKAAPVKAEAKAEAKAADESKAEAAAPPSPSPSA